MPINRIFQRLGLIKDDEICENCTLDERQMRHVLTFAQDYPVPIQSIGGIFWVYRGRPYRYDPSIPGERRRAWVAMATLLFQGVLALGVIPLMAGWWLDRFMPSIVVAIAGIGQVVFLYFVCNYVIKRAVMAEIASRASLRNTMGSAIDSVEVGSGRD